jgi:hypothetical protein
MNIASVAQQSYVGTTQQASALAAVSPDSFGVNSTNASAEASAPSGSNGVAASATLSSQTLQALMDLLQGDPAESSASGTSAAQPRHHHHHHGAPATTAATTPAGTSGAAAATAGTDASAEEGGDSNETATLATALGA